MFKLSKKKLERMAVEAVISEANKPNSLLVVLETSIEQEDGNLNKLMDQINSFVKMFL
ncbi:hypothetical protein IC801_15320 [Geobacillus sp. 44B]|nr:hypothetical protein IC801_15320 [Geobacillus sp. 44B]